MITRAFFSHFRSSPRAYRSPRANYRIAVVVVLATLALMGILARAVDLQVVDRDFYQRQGNNRFLRTVPIAVSRGTIFDRNGVPLAVSTPMETIWVNPQILLKHADRIPQLAVALGKKPNQLKQYVARHSDRQFLYLVRQMSPKQAQKALDLEIPGVYQKREYRRFYPSGAITAHVIGFTNIDGKGQAGLELSYNHWLTGKPGSKKVIKDGYGQIVDNVEQIHAPQPGKSLTLSIDRRIQYLTWRELRKAKTKFKAKSAAMIVMDPHNGEILSMVSLPSFNPNNLSTSTAEQRRNRVVTDVFEPGSTAKAFTVGAALASGQWTPTTKIDTGAGWYTIGSHTIHDDRPEGVLDVTGVITRSSNIGAAKIALSLDPDKMYAFFHKFGFGSSTHSGYPGESSGILPLGRDWRDIRQATIGYGYGFSVTLMQLAQAYSALANDGVLHHPTFVKAVHNPPERVLSSKADQQMRAILETVVENPRGTAYRTARIANYTVAGKTGTSHQAVDGGYAKKKYNSLFAGMVPANHPRLVGVVVVRDPKGKYFGTTVAAPIFKAVMQGALRILDIPPDNVDPKWVIKQASSDMNKVAVADSSQGGGQ